MKIAIIGTRGIPNRYGGFEQFASFVAPMLVRRGHQVSVYNSSCHGFSEPSWKGVEIITRYDPQSLMGTSGQFVYDLLCVLDARKRGYDLIFQLGYTSSSLWSGLMPSGAVLVTSMDGMEWKRNKYGWVARQFLRLAETWAVGASEVLIADALAMREYLLDKFGKTALYIPYGATPFCDPDPDALAPYQLRPFCYDLVIARFEPENHLEDILGGFAQMRTDRCLVVIGNSQNAYGRYLRKKFRRPEIHFMEGLYDMAVLNSLRFYSNIYYHGHSVGGTNPSLLEAMAASCLIVAHDNKFNREVLGEEAYYFARDRDITRLGDVPLLKSAHPHLLEDNLKKIRHRYNWEHILHLIERDIIEVYANRV